MKQFNIVHLGLGRVGSRVKQLITENKKRLIKKYQIDFRYLASFTYKKVCTQSMIKKFPDNSIIIDTTASDQTFDILKLALKKGFYVVMSNKKPLTSSQTLFDQLHLLGKNKLFYETTVGAGLPVIKTLKTLLETGDKILEIDGCFSGTLGFIASALDNGKLFSESVIKAKELGFTEPDPRDDLSGIDVARKALILARMTGLKIELSDIKIESLYPPSFKKYDVDGFLKNIDRLDYLYKNKLEKAKKQNNTYRYIANINNKKCSVGFKEIPFNSNLGSLKGPDNIIVLKTKRYNKNPLVIQGPGAEIDVTAAGVFGDILTIAGIT